MIYWNVYKNNCTGDFVYGDELTPMAPTWTFVTKYKTQEEAEKLCLKLNSTRPITVADFYMKTGVDWRTEFERYIESIQRIHLSNLSELTYESWEANYKKFAVANACVQWCPFEPGEVLTDYSKTFSFAVYEFASDGFYNYFEVGEGFTKEDYYFVRTFRNRSDAMEFVKDHNTAKRCQLNNIKQDLNQYVKMLIPEKTVILGTTMDWKEAMKALIEGKRVEARVCIPGLPESENVWFDVEFAAYPDCAETGFKIELGQDWEYRIKDDSKEREELFDECEKLGIINVSRVSKVSTPLLHDIVDAVKSTDLDWDEIAKQINEETK